MSDERNITPTPDPPAPPTEYQAVVLLVNDQNAVTEAISQLLFGENDIVFHLCAYSEDGVMAANHL